MIPGTIIRSFTAPQRVPTKSSSGSATRVIRLRAGVALLPYVAAREQLHVAADLRHAIGTVGIAIAAICGGDDQPARNPTKTRRMFHASSILPPIRGSRRSRKK